MNSDKYTIGVIGGGPGGYVAAIKAAQLGAKVLLVEKGQLGGTCLNRGCIPTKALLRSVEVIETVAHAKDYGVLVDKFSLDRSLLVKRKERVTAQLRQGVEGLLKANKVTVIKGTASFKDVHTIMVEVAAGETKEYNCDNFIIATGSKPAIINLPGIQGRNIMTSDEALELTYIPGRIAIIGGGVIGMEFATIYHALGSRVTVVEAMASILPAVDQEISQLLAKTLKHKGIEILTGAKILEIGDNAQGKTLTLEKDNARKVIEVDAILVAVGRAAETTGLNLEGIGVKLNGRNIAVDKYLITNLPNIYAIGDVIGGIQLAHVASQEGERAVLNILDKQLPMDYSIVPSCIYTIPEVACVGLTEDEVKKRGINYKVGRFPYVASGKALTHGDATGFAKIICDSQTGEILGAHLIGHNATDLISEMSLAMKLEGTIEEVADLIHPHPTISEIMKEAALDVTGHAIHIPPRK
ncbi:dihydrolipoyl dehydrogenase [Thermanaerosceptrum fracticalcis]|uniref:Dihydrolipoyl dehydrogenase n=1 Tax=Thermanaerosceptrum fracticalcis TaxID=1712410 RepID=A0A7G6E4E4_THEFR|nr:dihydrolipoyl dehydrogenase [Thermanaerosceptrum fracticalcis]QNB46948.1 dihydrolipoyl dehydrogenase [Thermanaerosceptrum fracticalcis]